MPGLVFIVKYQPNRSHLYPVNVCEPCASASHDFSRSEIPSEARANSTGNCPVCGILSNRIVYLRVIDNPDLLLDIRELRNLFSHAGIEFSLVSMFKALDDLRISILPGSGVSAMEHLRRWRDQNPTAILPNEHFHQLALLSEDPDLQSGSITDYRVGDLKNHMMRSAIRMSTAFRPPMMRPAASEEVNKLHKLQSLTRIRYREAEGSITDSIFEGL